MKKDFAVVANGAFWLISCMSLSYGLHGLDMTVMAAQSTTTVKSSAYGQTTLEQAMNRAYNAKIRDGTWASIFGRDSLRAFRADSFCTGSVDSWPIPEVEKDSDLERVLNDGVFKCGHLIKMNFGTPEGEVIFRTGPSTENVTVEGYAVEWWEHLVEELGNMYDTKLELKWLLTDGSQPSLDRLQNGEVDAGCVAWASDGTWKDGDGNKLARGLSMSPQTCPTYVQTEFVYVPVNSSLNSWSDLVEAMNSGEVTRVCASTSPGAGTEANCQNTLNQYTTEAGMVVCNGVNEESFPQLLTGECSATWAGFPTENKELFKTFPQPAAIARVSLFRSTDFTKQEIIGDPYHPIAERYMERTTLEQAVSRAFNMKVLDGSYASTFGGLTDIEAVSFCSGSVASWPMPKEVAPESDLARVLDRGVFRCGYRNNQRVANKDGDVMLDTTGPEVTGVVADFFNNFLIPTVGELYNTTLKVEWVLQAFEVGSLNQLYNGEIDSACGLWDPDGIWVLGQEVVARPLAFNTMYCPTYLATDNIYTVSGTYPTFEALVAGVNSGTIKTICVADDVTGGKVNTCTSTMIEYTDNDAQVECKGSTSTQLSANDEAFRRLNEGGCQAVWSGVVPTKLNAASYNSFPQPTVLAPVSLFRTFDVSSNQPDASPTSSPVQEDEDEDVPDTTSGTLGMSLTVTVAIMITAIVVDAAMSWF